MHVRFWPIQSNEISYRWTKLCGRNTSCQMGRNWRKHISSMKRLADRFQKVALVLQRANRLDSLAAQCKRQQAIIRANEKISLGPNRDCPAFAAYARIHNRYVNSSLRKIFVTRRKRERSPSNVTAGNCVRDVNHSGSWVDAGYNAL